MRNLGEGKRARVSSCVFRVASFLEDFQLTVIRGRRGPGGKGAGEEAGGQGKREDSSGVVTMCRLVLT